MKNLGEYLIEIRETGSSSLVTQCYRDHSKLARKFPKFGKVEGSYEGYLFEAISIAATEWDPSKGGACTCLFRVAQRLIQQSRRDECYVGGVRVPLMTRDRYQAVDHTKWAIESGILDIEQQGEADNT